MKELIEMNQESQGRVKYDQHTLFHQLLVFTDRVIKNSKNGYLGYKVEYK